MAQVATYKSNLSGIRLDKRDKSSDTGDNYRADSETCYGARYNIRLEESAISCMRGRTDLTASVTTPPSEYRSSSQYTAYTYMALLAIQAIILIKPTIAQYHWIAHYTTSRFRQTASPCPWQIQQAAILS